MSGAKATFQAVPRGGTPNPLLNALQSWPSSLGLLYEATVLPLLGLVSAGVHKTFPKPLSLGLGFPEWGAHRLCKGACLSH